MAKHVSNLGAYYIIELFLIFHIEYVVFNDQEKIIFYINNYINKNQFSKLYIPYWLKTGV